MSRLQFSPEQLSVIAEAVEIAEDLTSNYYKISASQWRGMRYDIKTLIDLLPEEITDKAFAQVIKYSRTAEQMPRLDRRYDYYLICLQDHNILDAVEREPELELLPLALYIVTHELVHMVRFFKFISMFETPSQERGKEESVVHSITYEILKSRKWPKMEYVLDSYTPLRAIDEVLV